MSKIFKGIVIEESLIDNRILNQMNIVDFHITEQAEVSERWHMYTVEIAEDVIPDLIHAIQDDWYMHFWSDDNVYVIYPQKYFQFRHSDKKSWQPAIDHGLSIGIIREQLDFPID